MKNVSVFIVALTLIACSQNEQKKTDIAQSQSTSSPAEKAEQLYKINCMQCHLPGKDFAGPALENVRSRWQKKELLYEFVKNPQAVIAKDDYAASLFEKWKQAPMNPSPHLSNEEIDAILDYCDEQAKLK